LQSINPLFSPTAVLFLTATPVTANKSVYGYLEPVTLAPDEVTLTAKLDTGAETASISATDIQLYEKEGEVSNMLTNKQKFAKFASAWLEKV
jgi:hypothetical protein